MISLDHLKGLVNELVEKSDDADLLDFILKLLIAEGCD